jgi:hypothetical protein
MDAVWQWVAGAGWGLVFTLIGYIFNRLLRHRDQVAALAQQLAKAAADLTGMTTAYNRERERVNEMEAVERDAKQAAAIGLAVAKALGKDVPSEQVT